jgi:hypothetical protein
MTGHLLSMVQALIVLLLFTPLVSSNSSSYKFINFTNREGLTSLTPPLLIEVPVTC